MKILVIDKPTVGSNHHQLATHHFKGVADISPGNFKALVERYFKSVKQEHNSVIIYAAMLRGRNVHLEAKLYRAVDQSTIVDGQRIHTPFSMFYRPDGERWRLDAGIVKFYDMSGKEYLSRPAINPHYADTITGQRFRFQGKVVTIKDGATANG